MNAKGVLFVCGTPIGNMKDITLRVLECLTEADAVACEDTRVTGKILARYGIKAPLLLSSHEHNYKEASEKIIKILEEGKNVALVTDAGMPVVSDPGAQVIRSCRKAGFTVTVLPGPAAFVTALALTGLEGPFAFDGFLPRKEKEIRQWLKERENEKRTVIFYESPRRLISTLKIVGEEYGEREIFVCRELTKMYEEMISGTGTELADEFSSRSSVKGELVVLIPPGDEKKDEADPEAIFLELLELGFTKKEALRETADRTGIPKRELYRKFMT